MMPILESLPVMLKGVSASEITDKASKNPHPPPPPPPPK